MPRDNARHERRENVYVYLRRGKLDVQLRAHRAGARDVIFSCCNSSLVRASSREPPGATERKEYVALARAVLVLSFSRSHARASERANEGRRGSGRILQTRVCNRKQKSDEQPAEPVTYIFHVSISASVSASPREKFSSKEKCFCLIIPLPFFLFNPKRKKKRRVLLASMRREKQ